MPQSSSPLKFMVLCGFFAALTAVLAQIALPLPFTPVPIQLATLSVFLAGGLLGPKWGSFSQLVYLLLGAFGLPVFSGLSGGAGILLGPTGGYLLGYVLAAFITGLFYKRFPVLSLLLGLFLCYCLGTLWFMYISKTELLPSLVMCVFPFLPGDALKMTAAFFLLKRLSVLNL